MCVYFCNVAFSHLHNNCTVAIFLCPAHRHAFVSMEEKKESIFEFKSTWVCVVQSTLTVYSFSAIHLLWMNSSAIRNCFPVKKKKQHAALKPEMEKKKKNKWTCNFFSASVSIFAKALSIIGFIICIKSNVCDVSIVAKVAANFHPPGFKHTYTHTIADKDKDKDKDKARALYLIAKHGNFHCLSHDAHLINCLVEFLISLESSV